MKDNKITKFCVDREVYRKQSGDQFCPVSKVLENMPLWAPGRQRPRNRPILVFFQLLFRFGLE